MVDPTPAEKELTNHYFQVLDDMVLLCFAALPEEIRWEGSNCRRLTVMLFNRCLRLFRSIRTLLHEGSPAEAQILVRPLISDAFVLLYFLKNLEQAEKLAIRYLHKSLTIDLWIQKDAARAIGFDPDPNWVGSVIEAIEKLERDATACGMNAIRRFPEIRDVVKAVGDPRIYWAYQVMSNAIHTSYTALSSYAEDGESLTEMYWEGSPYEITTVGDIAGELILNAMIATAALLQLPHGGALLDARDALLERLVRESDAIASAFGSRRSWQRDAGR